MQKKDENEIINSTYEKFKETNLISYGYITEFLKAIIDGKKEYDSIMIPLEELGKATNDVMEIRYFIQNSIYYKLCRMSEEDADALLFLVEDRKSMANIVFKKMGFNDLAKQEDYLMEAISNFRGDENFNSYITRYLMAKVKGTNFVYKSEQMTSIKVEDTSKPIKKKKKKNRSNSLVVVQVKGGLSCEETSIEEKPLVEQEEVLGDSIKEEIDVMEDETSTIGEIEKVVNDSGERKQDKDISDSIINRASKSSFNPYVELKSRCGAIKGTGQKDSLVISSLNVGLTNVIDAKEDSNYEMYLLLRLGFINRSYYTREEIAKIVDISILQVIEYERKTWKYIKEIYGEKFNSYEDYILNKIK